MAIEDPIPDRLCGLPSKGNSRANTVKSRWHSVGTPSRSPRELRPRRISGARPGRTRGAAYRRAPAFGQTAEGRARPQTRRTRTLAPTPAAGPARTARLFPLESLLPVDDACEVEFSLARFLATNPRWRRTSNVAQVINYLPMHSFRRYVQRYRGHLKIQSFSCLVQYLCMAFTQLTYRQSLRDKLARYRGVPARPAGQALPYGRSRQGLAQHLGRRQRGISSFVVRESGLV